MAPAVDDFELVRHARFGASATVAIHDSDFAVFEYDAKSVAHDSSAAEAFDRGCDKETPTSDLIRNPGAPPVMRGAVDSSSYVAPAAAPAPAAAGAPLAAIDAREGALPRKPGAAAAVTTEVDAAFIPAQKKPSIAPSSAGAPLGAIDSREGASPRKPGAAVAITTEVDAAFMSMQETRPTSSAVFAPAPAVARAVAPAVAPAVARAAVAPPVRDTTSQVATAIAKLPATKHTAKKKDATVDAVKKAASALDKQAERVAALTEEISKVRVAPDGGKKAKQLEREHEKGMVILKKRQDEYGASVDKIPAVIEAVRASTTTDAEKTLVDEAAQQLASIPEFADMPKIAFTLDVEKNKCVGEHGGVRYECPTIENNACPVFASGRCRVVGPTQPPPSLFK